LYRVLFLGSLAFDLSAGHPKKNSRRAFFMLFNISTFFMSFFLSASLFASSDRLSDLAKDLNGKTGIYQLEGQEGDIPLSCPAQYDFSFEVRGKSLNARLDYLFSFEGEILPGITHFNDINGPMSVEERWYFEFNQKRVRYVDRTLIKEARICTGAILLRLCGDWRAQRKIIFSADEKSFTREMSYLYKGEERIGTCHYSKLNK
jgi:hypothetical protein